MALKLLEPSDGRNRAKKSLEADKYRLVEVQTLITQKYKELGQAEQDFDEALKKQRNLWAAEQQEHQNKILALTTTVEGLEERKRIALIPLTKRAEELDTKASALDAREAQLALQASGIAEGTQLLIERLDEVAEREIQADKVAKTLTQREQGINDQAAQVAAGSLRLTVAITEASKQAGDKQRELALKEVGLNSWGVTLTERERKVNAQEASFANREKAIADERFALAEAVKEAKQKYGIEQIIQRDTLRSDGDPRDGSGSV